MNEIKRVSDRKCKDLFIGLRVKFSLKVYEMIRLRVDMF